MPCSRSFQRRPKPYPAPPLHLTPHQAGALGEQVRQQHELHRQLAPLQLQAAEMAARKAPLQRAYQAAVDRLAAETQAKGAAQQALDVAKQVAAEAAALAREELGGAAAPGAELVAAWSGWPEDAGGLEALMADKTAEMEAAQAVRAGLLVVGGGGKG